MKKRIAILACILLALLCTAALADVEINETNFPDAAFRGCVSGYDNKPKDGILSDEELNAVEMILCEERGIASLKGIEYFQEVKILQCYKNQITSLDVSQNKKLEFLNAYENPLASLNVSNCTNLNSIDCMHCELTSLDVSSCPNLAKLQCLSNKLTSLITGNAPIEELICWDNELTALNISENRKLKKLECFVNKLTALDISGNTLLEELVCWDNQIEKFDFSKNTNLRKVNVHKNPASSIDVSMLAGLRYLSVSTMPISSLNLKNNPNLEQLYINYLTLPSLDLSSQKKLRMIWAIDVKLPRLDISSCPKLILLTKGTLGEYNETNNIWGNTDSDCLIVPKTQNINFGELNPDADDPDLEGMIRAGREKQYTCDYISGTNWDSSTYAYSAWQSESTDADVAYVMFIRKVRSWGTSDGRYQFKLEFTVVGKKPGTATVRVYPPNGKELVWEYTVTVYDDSAKYYSVSVTDDGNGTATANPAYGAEGTKVVLSAEPKAGYRLREWKVLSGNVNIQENTFTIGTEDVEIQAIFEEDPLAIHTVTVTVSDEKAGTASADPVSGKAGTEVALNSAPNAGYRFKDWKVISGGVEIRDNRFTMGNENVEIQAVFEPVPVSKIKLNKTKASLSNTLKKKGTVQIKATVTPSDALDTTVTWKSSNTKVAKVSKTGKVTAVGYGKCKITATANDGSGAKATCTVTVTLDEIQIGGLKYTLNHTQKTAKVTGPQKSSVKTVTIPDTIKANGKTYKVTEIAKAAFKGLKKLTMAKIGKNVAVIGEKAFYNCAALKIVTIETKKLTDQTVGAGAFGKNHAKAVYKCPAKKLNAYRKWMTKKGVPDRNQVQ